ncbi:MAG TPA: hypothetical protein VN688_14670 [Gemmataceae bacterium]|nr:hypothetical protein [Gemmataceae bacterium]
MDEHRPVEDSEFVYRRIHRVYYQAGLPIPLQAAAFRPTTNDATGLSVFRAVFVQPIDILASIEPGKRNDYYVVRLAVQELHRLGLTVVAEPEPNGPAGHAVIPELSWPVYQADKQRLKVIQLELAKLASAAVVHQPS